MWMRVSLLLTLLSAVTAHSQVVSPVDPAPFPGGGEMAVPPPLKIEAYPMVVGAEVRSNYLSTEMTFRTSYVDNIYEGIGTQPLSETAYSILPSITLDQTTPRQHIMLHCIPGFTFYEPSSQLNQIDEAASVAYLSRLTPHLTFSVSDNFMHSSTSFTSAVAGFGGLVTGSTPTVSPAVLAPFTRRLTNNAQGEVTLQTGRTTMIGVSGTATTLHYPKLSEADGLADSSSRGGSAFYNARISTSTYLGAMYDFSEIIDFPANAESDTRIHTPSVFYTFYPKESFSFSILCGPQYYQLTLPSSQTSAAWRPSVTLSAGWQGFNASFAASYSHGITAGAGLLGAFRTNIASATVSWQMSRAWTTSLGAGYAIQKAVEASFFAGSQNGHTVSGSATLDYAIVPGLGLGIEYDRLHESFRGIPVISNNPDANRVQVGLSWRFMRPLGR
jgi:hypothetical protein